MIDPSRDHEPERLQRQVLEQILEQSPLSPFEKFRDFPVYTPRYNLARFLAHYEIFKRIAEVPGVIIDMGVYRGASTFTWAKLCEIFCPTDIRKTVYGFDTFQGFPDLSEADGPENPKNDVLVGGYCAGAHVEKSLMLAQDAMNFDRHLKHKNRVQFIKGDVCETVPKFIDQKGNGLRVSLLNLDLDLYQPTKTALECFFSLMSPGGIIVLDEYAVETFGGETKAVDEFFLTKLGKRPAIKKFQWHSNPSGYIEVNW